MVRLMQMLSLLHWPFLYEVVALQPEDPSVHVCMVSIPVGSWCTAGALSWSAAVP